MPSWSQVLNDEIVRVNNIVTFFVLLLYSTIISLFCIQITHSLSLNLIKIFVLTIQSIFVFVF